MKIKYLVLKLQHQFDVIKLRNKLNELIDGDTAIGISMKWLDIADILISLDNEKLETKNIEMEEKDNE